MERQDLKVGMVVSVWEGAIEDESYVPYKVRVLEVGSFDGCGRIKGRVLEHSGGSGFYFGNLNKGDLIWFAPFQALEEIKRSTLFV